MNGVYIYMDYEELQDNIRYLESLDEADFPVISCYLNVSAPYRSSFNEQVRGIIAGLEPEKRAAFWELFGRIEVFLGTNIALETQGVAIFARGGRKPFFLPLQFEVAFPNRVMAWHLPEIELLLEFRDSMFVPAEDMTGLIAGMGR